MSAAVGSWPAPSAPTLDPPVETPIIIVFLITLQFSLPTRHSITS